MISLLYISRNRIERAERDPVIDGIVQHARRKNLGLAVTGALMFTGERFAQVLEGPRDRVEALMATITADPRHDQVEVVITEEVESRRFANWSMAYMGLVPTGEPLITAVRQGEEGWSAAHRLITFLCEGASAELH